MLKKYIEEEEVVHRSQHAVAEAAEAKQPPHKKAPDVVAFNIADLEQQDERDQRRYEIQCELNVQGASDLVVDLFMSDISNKVFKENVLLAIALLEGGNTNVQVSRALSLLNCTYVFSLFYVYVENNLQQASQ